MCGMRREERSGEGSARFLFWFALGASYLTLEHLGRDETRRDEISSCLGVGSLRDGTATTRPQFLLALP